MSELREIFDMNMEFTEKIKKIKNIYSNKKAIYLTCGKNIEEYKTELRKMEKSNDTIVICYKKSIKYVNNYCDILIMDPRTTIVENIKTEFTMMFNDIVNIDKKKLDQKYEYDILINNAKKKHLGFVDLIDYNFFNEIDNINNTITNGRLDTYFKVFLFLKYLGFKEIYLFGAYFSSIEDLNVDILVSKPNKIEQRNDLVVPKEPSVFLRNIQSSKLAEWAEKNMIEIFNVSSSGSMSKKIKRITFDNINKINKIFIKNNYDDIYDQIKIDYNYYSKTYKSYPSDIQYHNKLLSHYLNLGVYLFNNTNDKGKKKSININDIELLLCVIAYFACELPINEFDINNSELLKSSYMVHVYHILLYYGYNILKMSDVTIIPFNKKFTMMYFKSFIVQGEYWDGLTDEYKKLIKNNLNEFISIKAVLNYNYNKINYKLLDNFDLATYKKFNKDLVNNKMSDYELIKHYISYGYREKRICNLIKLPKDFNWQTYVNMYSDLKKCIKTETKAINHYLTHGLKEGRKYKEIKNIKPNEDFNWKDYIYLNDDLSYMKTEKEAFEHYILFGIKEKRLCSLKNKPYNFDWEIYLILNEDLSYIKSEKEAIIHYMKYGINENRKYEKLFFF